MCLGSMVVSAYYDMIHRDGCTKHINTANIFWLDTDMDVHSGHERNSCQNVPRFFLPLSNKF